MIEISQYPALYNLVPQNLEIEESILSFCITNGDKFEEVSDIIVPEDFYRTSHQTIYRACVNLCHKKEPIDILTITNNLRESDQLEKIGGATYLARLIDTIPLSHNIEHHAGIIKEKAVLRRLIQVSREIEKSCFEDRGDSEVIRQRPKGNTFNRGRNKDREV